MGTATIKARRLGYAALLAAAAAGLAQCGGGSSSSPTTPTTTASLQSISLNPTSIGGGNTVQGTATLTAAAPSGGATVTLSSSNTSVATVPSSVVVPQGSATATFTVTALVVGSTTTATISGTYLNVTQTAPLSVTAQSVHADFIVTPDSGTTVSAGQCSASQVSGTSTQKLLCTFDASSATPSSGITEYRWTLPGASTPQFGVKLSDAIIPCGGFSSAGTQKDVTLKITASGGTDTTTKSITFVKGAPC
jgi:hypothetical protein